MKLYSSLFARVLMLTVSSLISNKILIAQYVQTLPANQLVLPSKDFVVIFSWQGDSIHGKWEANTAMLIPVHIKKCPRVFYMQFDLGSPYSLLYKNKVDGIRQKYPDAITSLQTKEKLENFSFVLDKTPLLAKEIIIKQFDSTTIDWKDNNAIEVIGTIGTDLVDGKVAMINYPNQKLSISQGIPQKLMQRLSLTDFVYANRSILLPAKIKDKETMLYFDTGSSMFELLSDKETCNQLATHDTAVTRFPVKSWDKELTANTLTVNQNIEFANTTIPLRSCTYMDGVSDSQVEHMLKLGIGGMIGNKLFLNYILVLDTQLKKFGLTR